MNIIVVGGAGFLGSHLCEYYLQNGDTVVCIDNLSTGNMQNVQNFRENPRYSFIQHDVVQGMPDVEADYVFHMASPASPNKNSPKSYHALAFETMQVNTTGTWKIAEFCVAKGARMLFASTSETYGDPLEHPQKESYRGNVSTIGPRSVYDEAKRFGETIVSAFVRSKGLHGRLVRIFNTYGPRMALDDGRVVIEFVRAALENKPIPIFGDGSQTRSFCYVDDLVEGLRTVMETEGIDGDVFNLGNPEEYTVVDLAKKVIALTGSKSEIAFVEKLPTDDPLKRRPDISKAHERLGFAPRVSVDDGIMKLIEYIKSTK